MRLWHRTVANGGIRSGMQAEPVIRSVTLTGQHIKKTPRLEAGCLSGGAAGTV